MKYKENSINQAEKLNMSNNINDNSGINHFYDRISAINTPLTKNILNEINKEYNINMIEKPIGCLIYKSIFNSLDKNKNKENGNNITDGNINFINEKERRKNNLLNTSSKKINRNQKYTINLKKQFQNIRNDLEMSNDDLYYNLKNININNNMNNMNNINNIDNINNINIFDNEINNTDFLSNNYQTGKLSKDIKYQKQYSANQDTNNKEYLNYLLNENDTLFNMSNFQDNKNLEKPHNQKTLKYQKSEDNLNKNGILDKQEFMKNIKEIDGLEYLDENNNNFNYNKTEIFPEKELLSNNENLNEKNNIVKKNIILKNNIKSNTGRNKKNYYLSLPNNKNKKLLSFAKSPKNSFISTTNNSYYNNIVYNKNTYNSNYNNNNNIIINNNYRNKRNISKDKEIIYMNNLSNFENNLEDNKLQFNGMATSNSNNILNKKNKFGLDFNNLNTFYNNNMEKHNSYRISPENNGQNQFSTLSNADIEKSISNNKPKENQIDNKNIEYKNFESLIQNKMINYNKINNNNNSFNTNFDNLTNEFSKSIGNYNTKNTNESNNISNASGSNNYLEKEKYENLKKEFKKKDKIIEKLSNIIKEYKEKNNKLLEKNKQLQEDSKSKVIKLYEQIKEYQKEIYRLKNNIDAMKRNSGKTSKNENYNINIYNYNDYINQINELKDEVEKYKKENNNLKILAIQYKNNNIKSNDYYNQIQKQIEDNSINRFNSTSNNGIDKKSGKKSYSVTKTKKRIRASSLSKKNFEEGDLDEPSDYNRVSSFMI